VVREVEDLGPGAVGFAPDDYFAVVARRGEDVAVFGVGPGDGPDGAFVSVCVREGDGRGGGEGKYPLRVSVNLWESPSTSKILTVLSEEQVARRRP
jgi:hypothetical protein